MGCAERSNRHVGCRDYKPHLTRWRRCSGGHGAGCGEVRVSCEDFREGFDGSCWGEVGFTQVVIIGADSCEGVGRLAGGRVDAVDVHECRVDPLHELRHTDDVESGGLAGGEVENMSHVNIGEARDDQSATHGACDGERAEEADDVVVEAAVGCVEKETVGGGDVAGWATEWYPEGRRVGRNL